MIRHMLGVLSGAILLSSAHVALAEELPDFRFGIDGGAPMITSVIAYYAHTQGHFEDAGVDVTLRPMNWKEIPAAIANGSVDGGDVLSSVKICHTTRDECNLQIAGITNQVGAYIIAANRQLVEKHPSIEDNLVAAMHRASPDNPGEDGVFVPVATNNCKGGNSSLLMLMIRREFPDAKIYCGSAGNIPANANAALIKTGGSSARAEAAALRRHDVGIGMLYVPYHYPKLEKYGERLMAVSDVDDISRLLYTTQHGLVVPSDTDGEVVCRVMDGLQRAMRAWRANPDASRQFLTTFYAENDYPMDEDQVEWLYDLTLKMQPQMGMVPAARMQEWADAFFRRENVDLGPIVDFSNVPVVGDGCQYAG